MESTLAYKLSDLEAAVGFNLGYGRGANFSEPAWSTRQQNTITEDIKVGLAQFYWPPPLEGRWASYDWSFLRPAVTLTLPSASADTPLPLPDDFGGIEGQVSVMQSNGNVPWPLPVVNPGVVREEFAKLPTRTGRPLFCAVEPLKGTSAGAGQRWQLLVYPIPDGDYTLCFTYYVAPNFLTAANPYVYGGVAHSLTVSESCLYATEVRRDNLYDGPHRALFFERLEASINQDRKLKPQALGYNGDRSDAQSFDNGLRRWWWNNPVSVNGVVYRG